MLLYRVSTAFDDVSSNGLTATSFLFLDIDMSEVKFTKGEWCIRLVDGKFAIMRHDTGYGICSTVMCDDTDKANAHIIAAAPSMYAMLECIDDLLGLLDEHTHSSIELDCQQHEIRKILAKARGE